MNTYRIRIEGLVQGVGFRPFIYRLAGSLSLCGTVENRNNGVLIYINIVPDGIDTFIDNIKSLAPEHSRIDAITVEKISYRSYSDFSIIKSVNISENITGISPDIAVCDDCLTDMELQEKRINYPLINCTSCGPRFSIIKGVPYDRAMTTMSEFEMCISCNTEYNETSNRRFHAQPIACNNCGPSYSIHIGNTSDNRIINIIETVSRLIAEGSVIALKGTGGYHLICDAFNQSAVTSLRVSKVREGKPFAVMCRDISEVDKIAILNPSEAEMLTSWKRPVVLLESKGKLDPKISNGLNTVGVILPYMPFHYLLFNKLKTPVIVFTSGNISDQPVIIDDETALKSFSDMTAAVVTYNREIFNRTDDSVCKLIKGRQSVIRRSRGYTPSPVLVSFNAEGIFAAGAELANCFAIGKGEQVILSQHIGDLKNPETLDFYSSSFKRFSEMFRFKLKMIASDLHPDYLSSAFAEQLSNEKNIPVEIVQHHHAHIASCMSEYKLSEKVIGVAMDGVGLGTDGNIWGAEILIADLCDFERILHFEYVPVSGGDAVSFEPWRSGVAYLNKYIERDVCDMDYLKINTLGKDKITSYQKILRKGVNTHSYSSAGRLFDAVASITGVCLNADFHAEAPMRLESIITPGITKSYDFEINQREISFRKTFIGIVTDLKSGISAGEISAVFHNTVAEAIVESVNKVFDMRDIRKVVLSGGTFQNKYLSEKVINDLTNEKFFVYFHNQVPSNDGGLALGQIAVAAARRAKGR